MKLFAWTAIGKPGEFSSSGIELFRATTDLEVAKWMLKTKFDCGISWDDDDPDNPDLSPESWIEHCKIQACIDAYTDTSNLEEHAAMLLRLLYDHEMRGSFEGCGSFAEVHVTDVE